MNLLSYIFTIIHNDCICYNLWFQKTVPSKRAFVDGEMFYRLRTIFPGTCVQVEPRAEELGRPQITLVTNNPKYSHFLSYLRAANNIMHNLHNVVKLLTVETICLTPHEGPTCNPVVGIQGSGFSEL